MAIAKSNQEVKRERQREKRVSVDKLTNKYMINLAWGIFGIVMLRFVESGYSSADTILQMPIILKVFVALAVALFVCAKVGVIKNVTRANNYGIFSIVAAVVSLWIAFYAQIRMAFGKVAPFLLTLDSRWWISWGLIILVVAYLVIALIITIVKIAAIEKGRK